MNVKKIITDIKMLINPRSEFDIKLTKDQKVKLKSIGCTLKISDVSTALKWIRKYKRFNVWIEHGKTSKKLGRTSDVTTSLGCFRTRCRTYDSAEVIGLNYALEHLIKNQSFKNIEIEEDDNDDVEKERERLNKKRRFK